MELEKEKLQEDLNSLKFFFDKKIDKKLTVEEKVFKKKVEEQSIEEYELLSAYNFHRKWSIAFLALTMVVVNWGIIRGILGASNFVLLSFGISTLIFLGMFMKHSLYCSVLKKQRRVGFFEWLTNKEGKIPTKLETYRYK